jgi:hypothetical protein
MNTMNMPGFTAETSLYKTSGHYRTGRQAIDLSTQMIGTIHLAATGVLRDVVVRGPGGVVGSGVYRDANGKCQLGTGGENDALVTGTERAACSLRCGTMVSDACAAEDGAGGCTVMCNCDPLHQSCDDVVRTGSGNFDIAITL